MITDHPVVPIQYLITSAMMAIKAGIDIETVWKSITVNAANHLGLQNQIGVLVEGKDADLVLWNKDPVTEGGEAIITIVDGEIVYQNSKYKEFL